MGCFAPFISIFFLVGFGLVGFGIWSARRSTEAANWPTTPGTLTNVALDTNSSGDGTSYQVQVEYSYMVDGQAYRGYRLAFGYVGSGDRPAHAEIYEKLKAAKTVDVRYDPEDPSTSSLSYGIHRSIQFMLAFGIFWLVFTTGFTLLWLLMSRNDNVLLENLSVR
jgi:hypothetical protein